MADNFSSVEEFQKYISGLSEQYKSIPIPSLENVALSSLFNQSTKLRDIRDKYMIEFPLLPDVILLYQQLASSREWQVTGKPRSTARAVEYLNESRTYDPKEGLEYIGFEDFQRRRVVDYLAVGRSAFLVENKGDYSKQKYLQYLDPTYLSVQRNDKTYPPKDNERIWRYYRNNATVNDLFKTKDVSISQPFPLGLSKYTSPVLLIYSTALLAYLIELHDSNELDGRVIRKIYLINSMLKDAVKTAVQASAALHSGAQTAADLGAPVIPVNNPTGSPLKDQIATLSLSELPENFDRKNFEEKYANMLSAVFGIPLRHFWQMSGAGSNRAAEIVQEARAQLKGPAAYVRSEQRLLNEAGIFEIFRSQGVTPRFTYVEEVDLATKKANIDVVLKGAMAAEKLKATFGDAISPEGYLSLMQYVGAIPYELELIKPELANTESENVESSDTNLVDPKEDSVESGDASELPQKKDYPDYGEIVMNLNGEVVERRSKVFSLVDYFKNNKNEKLDHEFDLVEEELEEDLDLFEAALAKTNKEYRDQVGDYISNKKDYGEVITRLPDDRVDEFLRVVSDYHIKGYIEIDDQDLVDEVHSILESLGYATATT